MLLRHSARSFEPRKNPVSDSDGATIHGALRMNPFVQNKFRSMVISIALCATAIALPAMAQNKQATPGYNNKIPEKIMTPDKVQTRLGTL